MFGTITENSILGEKFNDDDDDVDMFKINNSPDCICVLRNLCGADQASRSVAFKKAYNFLNNFISSFHCINLKEVKKFLNAVMF